MKWNLDYSMDVWIRCIDNAYKCSQTITNYNSNGHRLSLFCLLRVNDKMLISGSEDKTMKIWVSRGNNGIYRCVGTVYTYYPVYSIT